MRDLVISYYKQGLYDDDTMKLFVRVAYISAADYQELTGHEYVIGG